MKLITDQLGGTLQTETLSPRDRERTPTAASIYGETTAPRAKSEEKSEIGRKYEQYSAEGPGEARGPYYEPTWAAETIVRMYML
jgi:hypothetical protein